MRKGLQILIGILIISGCNRSEKTDLGKECHDQICVGAKLVRKGATTFEIHFSTDPESGNRLNINVLKDTLPAEKMEQFRFHFGKYVKLINNRDTLDAVFSHMEESGGAVSSLVQIIGFDTLIAASGPYLLDVNDIFFSGRHFSLISDK